jgi:hypothetical protein
MSETLSSFTEVISREHLASRVLNNPKDVNDSIISERLWKLMMDVDCEKFKSTVGLREMNANILI